MPLKVLDSLVNILPKDYYVKNRSKQPNTINGEKYFEAFLSSMYTS